MLKDPPADLKAIERDWIKSATASAAARDFRAFVFCMSEAAGDEAEVGDLSQWRLYGGDGRGVALLVDISDAEKERLLRKLGSIPRKVIYGEDEGVALVRHTLAEFIRSTRDLAAPEREELERNADLRVECILNSVFWLPSVIKHKAYHHEREVRLIRGDVGAKAGNPLVFFEKGSIRRPSIELPISRLLGSAKDSHHESPLRAVIIGPSTAEQIPAKGRRKSRPLGVRSVLLGMG